MSLRQGEGWVPRGCCLDKGGRYHHPLQLRHHRRVVAACGAALAAVCRELCDRVLDVARLRERAAAAAVDCTFADDAFDAQSAGSAVPATKTSA